MKQRPCIVCARDADHARRLMAEAEDGRPLILLSVRPVHNHPVENAMFVEEMYRAAQEHQAEAALLFSDYPALAAAQFVRQREAGQVILGKPRHAGADFVRAIRHQLPRVRVTDTAEEEVYCFCPPAAVTVPVAQ